MGLLDIAKQAAGKLSSVIPGGSIASGAVSAAKSAPNLTGGFVYGAGEALGKGIGKVAGRVFDTDGWRVGIAAGLALLVHVADYQYFSFGYSPLRIMMYALFSVIVASMLFKDAGQERTQTLKAILMTSLFFLVFTNLLVMYIPRWWTGSTGTAEFIAGLTLLGISFARPGIFVKGPLLTGVHTCFLLSAVFTPYMTSGVAQDLLSNLPNATFIWTKLLSPLFWPWFLYYILFFTNYKSMALRIIAFILLVLFLSPLWYSAYQNEVAGQGSTGLAEDQKQGFWAYWAKAKETGTQVSSQSFLIVNQSVTDVKCWWAGLNLNPSAALGGTATGTLPAYCKSGSSSTDSQADNFDASVESGALSSAGISLDPIISAQQKIYANQDNTFLSLIKAQSFDTPVQVNASCSASLTSGNKASKKGLLSQSDFTFTRNADSKDLTCQIPAGSLDASRSYSLDIGADFTYVTSAYLRRYFTKQGLLSQFASRSTTPTDGFFSFYQIPDTDPKSVSTKGPVVLGLDVVNPVIELADENTGRSTTFTIRMQLRNSVSWKGKIKGVNTIVLSIPKGFSIVQGIQQPRPKGFADGTYTWSNLACTVAGFAGNFQQITSDTCDNIVSDPSNIFNLNCQDYNNYILTPAGDTSRTAVAVDAGAEKNQQVYLTCQVQADNPTQILNGAPFAVKSIRAMTGYVYSIHQSKSFKTEANLPGTNVVYADKVLMSRTFCGTDNSFSLDPVLDDVFVGDTVAKDNTLRQQYDAMISTITNTINNQPAGATPVSDNGLLAASGDCQSKSIAQAIVMYNWNQVVGNPMITGTSYGYLRANKAMISYLNASGISSYEAQLKLSSADLDTYLRSNYLKVGMDYIRQLYSDCKNDPSQLTCTIGKYQCGVSYKTGDTSSCGTRTVPEIMTYATQIAQIVQPTSAAAN